MTDEQIVNWILAETNRERVMFQSSVRSNLGYDIAIGGGQSLVATLDMPITRDALVARITEVVNARVLNRLK